MGRYYWDKKDTVEDYDDLDVFWLKNHDYFRGYKRGGITWTNGFGRKSTIGFSVNTDNEPKYIRLEYKVTNKETGDAKEYDYQIQLVTTPCNYGGERYWFICPLVINGKTCGKRVAKLYGAGGYFGCRHCHNLSYDSRNVTRDGRFSALFNDYRVSMQIRDLQSKTTRRFYAGKPTKKMRKLMNLYNRIKTC